MNYLFMPYPSDVMDYLKNDPKFDKCKTYGVSHKAVVKRCKNKSKRGRRK